MKKQVNLILNYEWNSLKEFCINKGLDINNVGNLFQDYTIEKEIAENLKVGEIINPSILKHTNVNGKQTIKIYEMFGVRLKLENRYENEEGLTLVFGIPKPGFETPISHFQ